MAAATNRAQNYIPISNSNKMKTAAQPRIAPPQRGKVEYLDDLRRQKQSLSSVRGKMDDTDFAYSKNLQNRRTQEERQQTKNFQNRKIETGSVQSHTVQGRKIESNISYSKNTQGRKIEQNRGYSKNNTQGRRVSAQGEIALPMPGSNRKLKSQAVSQNKAASNVQAAKRPEGVVSTILLIIAVFGILSFLMTRNASITNISIENSEIETRIGTLTQNIDELKLDIALKEDLGYIQERAAELNMSTPENSQIAYLPQDSATEMAVVQETNTTTENDSSFSFSDLIQKIKSWFE